MQDTVEVGRRVVFASDAAAVMREQTPALVRQISFAGFRAKSRSHPSPRTGSCGTTSKPFRAQAASLRDGEGLPRFVEQEFRDFLRWDVWPAGLPVFGVAA